MLLVASEGKIDWKQLQVADDAGRFREEVGDFRRRQVGSRKRHGDRRKRQGDWRRRPQGQCHGVVLARFRVRPGPYDCPNPEHIRTSQGGRGRVRSRSRAGSHRLCDCGCSVRVNSAWGQGPVTSQNGRGPCTYRMCTRRRLWRQPSDATRTRTYITSE